MRRDILDPKRRATQKLVNALVSTHLDTGIIAHSEAENVYQYYMKHPELLMAIMNEPMRMELLGFTNAEESRRLCLGVLQEYVCFEDISNAPRPIPDEKKYQFAKVYSLSRAA